MEFDNKYCNVCEKHFSNPQALMIHERKARTHLNKVAQLESNIPVQTEKGETMAGDVYCKDCDDKKDIIRDLENQNKEIKYENEKQISDIEKQAQQNEGHKSVLEHLECTGCGEEGFKELESKYLIYPKEKLEGEGKLEFLKVVSPEFKDLVENGLDLGKNVKFTGGHSTND